LIEGTEGRGLRWEEKITTTVKPCPRGYHTANLVRDIMVMVGGSDGKECFTDIWLLNLSEYIELRHFQYFALTHEQHL
jgi:hypothetical protein